VVEVTMDVQSWLRKQLEQASPDLLRAMVQDFAEALMGAEADALCGASYGERSPERVNIRNGYREQGWDTRAGTIELAIPKLRQGSYFPDQQVVGGPLSLRPDGSDSSSRIKQPNLSHPVVSRRYQLIRSVLMSKQAQGLVRPRQFEASLVVLRHRRQCVLPSMQGTHPSGDDPLTVCDGLA
jgi:hypothetical protein